ncbi:MAG: hypothetical protein L3J31_03195 [Bacteroidales bacterium]|nr:hypothetical protein [Bacteroidales bacterium]MCF6341795.1 hypothetical protein [Bacteroidales bacterium]
MKTKIFFIVILLSASQFAFSQKVDINGFVRNYTGVLYENGEFNMLQNTLNLNFDLMGDRVAFRANPLVYLYGIDSLDFNMREIYLDLYFDNFDIRVGKQQIVWGRADGVFITDIVSPLNLFEFLLPDFDEIRIGVYAAKVDYYFGNSTIEAIWKPVFAANIFPQEGSIWNKPPEFPAPTSFDYSKQSIKPSLENSEIYLKYALSSSAIDFDLMGAYTWDATPTMYVDRFYGFDTATNQPVLDSLLITPEYNRLALAGGSFTSTIKSFVIRGEAAYYFGKYFQTADPLAEGALVQKDYLHYVVGLDYGIGNLKLSTQFIQRYIFDYDDLIDSDEFDNTMTFLARYDAVRETLHLELFSYVGLNYGDALIRPKITYDFSDSFSILLGSNIFVGDERGLFGRYGDNSMIYTKIKYNF